MTNSILYEYPLSERNRVLMRLEHLFEQIEYFLVNETERGTLAAIHVLIEIINILERSDVRSEIIKELDRQYITLKKLLSTPEVNREKLEGTLEQLESQVKVFQGTASKQSKILRKDELLNSICQRLSLSSSLCRFDIPGLYYWLQQDVKIQHNQFKQWLANLDIFHSSVKLLLQLIRNSTLFEKQTAKAGFFQKALEHQISCQMIRILLPKQQTIFPEISGNKHRVNVRFLKHIDTTTRPQQTSEDIEFKINCCYL